MTPMRSVAALALVVALLAGCDDSSYDGPGGDDKPYEPTQDRTPAVSSDEAQAEYGGLANDVASALAEDAETTLANDGDAVYGQGEDGVCEFSSVEYQLPANFGSEDSGDLGWDDVRTTVEDVLGDDWRVNDMLEIPGGYTGFNATEEATGALVVVLAKTTSTVQVIAPVTGDCGDEASKSPVPASH